MFNQDEIKIAQIKDLRLLYIYNCEESLSDLNTPYFGLKIVYDGDKKLDYNYKDEYFNKYLTKVIEVYNHEKESGKIRFLDDKTEKVFNEIDAFPKIRIKTDLGNVQNFKLTGFNTRKMELSIIKPYVKDLIIKFLWSVKQSEDIRIISIDGNNNKFICQYMIKNKNFVVPMVITKSAYDHYKIIFSYTKGNVIKLTGNINLRQNSIVSNWMDEDKIIVGKNVYHSEDNKSEKYVTTSKGFIFYDNEVPELNDEDIKLINKLNEIISLNKVDNIRKTLDNCYILTSEEKLEDNTDLILKNNAFVTVNNNMADIVYRKNYGINKANNQLFITLDEEIISITFKLEKINDRNVLVVQKSFLSSVNNNGEYKHELAGKYSYDFYVIDSDDLRKSFNILRKIDINHEVNSLNDIKPFIRK